VGGGGLTEAVQRVPGRVRARRPPGVWWGGCGRREPMGLAGRVRERRLAARRGRIQGARGRNRAGARQRWGVGWSAGIVRVPIHDPHAQREAGESEGEAPQGCKEVVDDLHSFSVVVIEGSVSCRRRARHAPCRRSVSAGCSLSQGVASGTRSIPLSHACLDETSSAAAAIPRGMSAILQSARSVNGLGGQRRFRASEAVHTLPRWGAGLRRDPRVLPSGHSLR
jgi:hypothetical protein